LIFMRGLPRSGKSTRIKELLEEHPKAAVVSKDAIRLSIHGQPFIQQTESLVHLFQEHMIRSLLFGGHDVVIIDECNVNVLGIQAVLNRFPGIECYYEELSTPAYVCIERAKACGQEYLVDIILEMDKQRDFITL